MLVAASFLKLKKKWATEPVKYLLLVPVHRTMRRRHRPLSQSSVELNMKNPRVEKQMLSPLSWMCLMLWSPTSLAVMSSSPEPSPVHSQMSQVFSGVLPCVCVLSVFWGARLLPLSLSPSLSLSAAAHSSGLTCISFPWSTPELKTLDCSVHSVVLCSLAQSLWIATWNVGSCSVVSCLLVISAFVVCSPAFTAPQSWLYAIPWKAVALSRWSST